MKIKRYAIYFMPDGALGNFGASWLGWDPKLGTRVPFLKLEGIYADHATLIKTPQKYGLHATLKAPFRLKKTYKEIELILGFEDFCAKALPARGGKLIPKTIGRCLALAPTTALEDINRLARECTRFFEPYRAPLNDAEIAKQQKRPLSQYQEQMLFEWGYPYVLDAFRFHITLTGRIAGKTAELLIQHLGSRLAPILSDPFVIPDLVLAGEDETGQFHELLRRDLKGCY